MRGLVSILLVCALAACHPPASIRVGAKTSNLFKALQTPSQFKAAIYKFEGLRGADDSNPAVIFDLETPGFVPAIVDLTEQDQQLFSGEVPERYLGRYTHCRITLGAAGQEIRYRDASAVDQTQRYIEFLEEFDNAAGVYDVLPRSLIGRGDVLIASASGYQWFEIDASKQSHTSAVRSALVPYHDPTPGDAVQLIELTEPVLINEGGDYNLLINFDVTDTFSYGDRDGDGFFEPLSDDHDGTINGFEFSIGVPAISVASAPVAGE
jgi:hypothetical protein